MGNNIIKPAELVNQLVNKQDDNSNPPTSVNPTDCEKIIVQVNDYNTYKITKPFYTIKNINCSNYSVHTKCSEQEEHCEVCKNFAYRDWYTQNNAKKIPILGNYADSKAEYNRTWIQTCNLGIGIFLLSIGIYYQQTN
jgi:hypothetical protein